MITPFSPIGATVNAAVTTTSAVVLLPVMVSGTLRIINSGTAIIFLNFGSSAATATAAAGMPMLPNTIETFAKGDVTHVAVIGAATGSTVYITAGAGL